MIDDGDSKGRERNLGIWGYKKLKVLRKVEFQISYYWHVFLELSTPTDSAKLLFHRLDHVDDSLACLGTSSIESVPRSPFYDVSSCPLFLGLHRTNTGCQHLF